MDSRLGVYDIFYLRLLCGCNGRTDVELCDRTYIEEQKLDCY